MQVLKFVCIIFAFALQIAVAQTVEVKAEPITDADIKLLRSDIQADKKQVITRAMQFTDAESNAFWPVYRDYARDQQAVGSERVQLIKDYAVGYDAMDDAKARNLTQRLLNIDAKFANLRQQYWPKFENAVGAKRAAKFFQVDNRLTLLINLQLVSEIPMLR